MPRRWTSPRGGAWQYGYTSAARTRDLSFDERDSAPFMPKCVVLDSRFDWGDDRAPACRWRTTVFYETHVRGFTKLMDPKVPHGVRGTFAGLAQRGPSRTSRSWA
jgi:isoamylase